ncbi:MAG TPA: helix-turn-helix domain-containing protein [Iamia sp.]|nr:helix-turn-helix domain-containing protein [Iamia sp.]
MSATAHAHSTTDLGHRYETATDLARRTGVGVSTVRQWRLQGLPSYKFGRARRFRVDEVDAWLVEHHRAAS